MSPGSWALWLWLRMTRHLCYKITIHALHSIFQDFPCSKFRGAAPRTPLMHIQHPHREYIFSTTAHIASLCHWYCSRIFIVVTAPGDFLCVMKITLLLCGGGWPVKQHTHINITHRHRGRDLSDTHSIIRLQHWHWVLGTLYKMLPLDRYYIEG